MGIMDIDTVSLDESSGEIVIIDQTKLPGSTEMLRLSEQKDIWDAIYHLKVRGAPAIGVTAAFGIYLAVERIMSADFEGFMRKFAQAKDYLDSSRPTAVNLGWALRRMEGVALANSEKPLSEIKTLLKREALLIRDEDIAMCRGIGENGLELLAPGMGLLTHCNAGKLATVRYGTATAPIYLGHEKGYNFKVFCDETRPLLQGARLTAYELYESGVNTTLICDNMAASVMAQGLVSAVLVGCDRVAANGDTANKIGTSYVALAAKEYGIPFYVCAPTSTIDMECADGSGINIELRPDSEVTEMWYERRMAPEGVKVYNPAFDVTPAGNITAIITEKGVARPPYGQSLRVIMQAP